MIDCETIALQLYTVRDDLARDFSGTLRTIAGYGYRAVEAADFPAGVTVHAAKAMFDDLGLQVIGAHSPLPLGDERDVVLENITALGAEYLVCPWLSPELYFQNLDGIKKACEMLNEANAVAKSAGVKLAYHNHWFEMETLEGKPAYQHMLAYLENDILFELDTYWARAAGLNPVDVMADLQGRLPLLHLKDGPAQNRTDNMVALGDGAMDIPAILKASASQWHGTQWRVVELDRCDTDMMTAVQESYNYLIGLDR